MIVETAEIVETFLVELAGTRSSLLLLDYDGTLAPFRVDRMRALPYVGVREALARIQRQGRTRIVAITGRPAKEVALLLRGSPPVIEEPIEIWGLHGAERVHPDGRREIELAPPDVQRRLDALKEHLRHNSLGGCFEDKPNAAVMHWRGASERTARFIEQRTRELFEPLSTLEGLSLLPFEEGLELRAGRNKGGAVKALIAETSIDTPVAYLGDDLSDEAAFAEVNDHGGPHLSVLMRPEFRNTAADAWMRPPTELRGFLKQWQRALA